MAHPQQNGSTARQLRISELGQPVVGQPLDCDILNLFAPMPTNANEQQLPGTQAHPPPNPFAADGLDLNYLSVHQLVSRVAPVNNSNGGDVDPEFGAVPSGCFGMAASINPSVSDQAPEVSIAVPPPPPPSASVFSGPSAMDAACAGSLGMPSGHDGFSVMPAAGAASLAMPAVYTKSLASVAAHDGSRTPTAMHLRSSTKPGAPTARASSWSTPTVHSGSSVTGTTHATSSAMPAARANRTACAVTKTINMTRGSMALAANTKVPAELPYPEGFLRPEEPTQLARSKTKKRAANDDAGSDDDDAESDDDEGDDDPIAAQRRRNIEAARRSRARKKAKMSFLELRIGELETKNGELKAQIGALETENRELQGWLELLIVGPATF
ncbi:hypothetical protein AMAG_14665 [Allomyces macrogynus ATCC 38327]|uniref:BZIP domain-containing protein n=1 Tax=Allomyces macrogynus (strain ATCC 38327) TaxID=578462 RepID=A0A0L0T6X3_ALLM3|nr:hypothetical protein AMAG_14665 [Allomyces macrogynus ATCC 38327]|eukprot:KNE70543.1 hypothetical protein AMAG_14665 [Allomyces macrogynus ATCC 38327]